MSENHCKDCCCAQSWKALGITEYTGKSIPDHIAGLRLERDDLLFALQLALEWIDAVPADTPLPSMPGFDRDWVNDIIAKATGEAP